jgi:hypothetical protein
MSAPEQLPDYALVLVAIMPNQRDLDIARLLGWYRIPLKSAPKVIAVDYLAFYQTGAFGSSQRWQIRYLAKVLGVELVRRKDLLKDEREHPRAEEEYFKLQIGPLMSLAEPVSSGAWKRVSFFYTTMGRVKAARTLKDLPVHDEERQVLWHALRERAAKDQEYQVNAPELNLSDAQLLELLGGLVLKESQG